MGELIRTPLSEINATLEVLDKNGVTPQDFEFLRKASSRQQSIIALAHKKDPFVWALLEMVQTVKKVGFKVDDFLMLSKSEDNLREILALIHNINKASITEHIIDCDANPFSPDGWKVEKHCTAGQLKWEIEKVLLYLSERQNKGKAINGNNLCKELEKMQTLNANVLDFLLKPENQHLIPENWKGKAVFFWGTIYRGSDGRLFVRYLGWGDMRWGWRCSWLGIDFGDDSRPAALLASN